LFVFYSLINQKQHIHEKNDLTSLLLEVIDGVSKFSDCSVAIEHTDELWPNPSKSSLVEVIIMGNESVSNTTYCVTKSYLKAFLGLFRVIADFIFWLLLDII